MSEQGSPPPLKRRRSAGRIPSPAVASSSFLATIRSPSFWLSDGNLIVITREVSFRVHTSVLSRNSEVFRDMLAIPQPDNAEQVEGCSVVQLSEDGCDFETLLLALYDGGKIFGDHNVLRFRTVSAMLRLGMKYQIDLVSQEAIRRLRKFYPNYLEDFPMEYVINGRRPSVPPSIELEPEDSISVVRMAIMFDLQDILVAALYACCQLEVDTCFNAVRLGK
ncbi:unnamed protein product [Somion occarium]|uniref:BTB domain-containing protein n=1 Tax=Somion occarium TaxID=3059160 RepID=A0ABP1EB83_9APHY